MSGIINAAQPADDAGTPNPDASWSDPVLQAAEEKIEAGLDVAPANKQNYMKIVVAGMAAGYGGGANSPAAKLLKNPDPVQAAAKGTIALVMLLRREAKGVMPLKAMIPAAMTLMLRALDFINRAGKVKVGTPELIRATHIFANEAFRVFGITTPMLQRASQRVHQLTQDPASVQALQLKVGALKHPGALEPTALPAATPTPMPAA